MLWHLLCVLKRATNNICIISSTLILFFTDFWQDSELLICLNISLLAEFIITLMTHNIAAEHRSGGPTLINLCSSAGVIIETVLGFTSQRISSGPGKSQQCLNFLQKQQSKPHPSYPHYNQRTHTQRFLCICTTVCNGNCILLLHARSYMKLSSGPHLSSGRRLTRKY